MSKELKLLIQRIQPPQVKYSTEPPKPSPELTALMTRVENRRWRTWELQNIIDILEEWELELRLIEHARKCDRCLTELELDVGRYAGRRGPWYLDIQYETGGYPVYEEDPLYRDCPRLENYNMGSYWVAVNIPDETERQKYLQKRSAEIRRFILDRMKWGESKIRPLTEALVDYYIEVENWDLTSPLTAEPTLHTVFWGDVNGKTDQRMGSPPTADGSKPSVENRIRHRKRCQDERGHHSLVQQT